jgi:hypothetical protein
VSTLCTLRHAGRGFAAATLLWAAGCASAGTATQSPGPSPTSGPSTTTEGSTPVVQTTWPIRTREHVDVWLHAYALLTTDSTLVPYFRRGYRDQLLALRRQRGVTSLLDANRARLFERIAVQPSLATGPQFMPFYFASWEQLRQVVDLFIRAGGNPRATNDPALQQYFAVLGASFQSAADREWLRLLVESVDDESRKFYHEYWLSESRARAAATARIDSLWQRTWRPAFQRYLNNSQQQNGELYLSLPLGGEGRTVHFTKVQNAVAVGLPDAQNAETALYTFAHEVAGGVATTAIEDNTTPADRREGKTARFEQSAAVRAGAMLLERVLPSAVPGYMRYYLQTAGRSAPNDPRAAFASAFAVPDAVNEAIARQIEVILGGI